LSWIFCGNALIHGAFTNPTFAPMLMSSSDETYRDNGPTSFHHHLIKYLRPYLWDELVLEREYFACPETLMDPFFSAGSPIASE
jgi:hypothetical protein